MARILFVTGTDTGVGKTVFTALLLAALRRQGIRALAMKPFCTGDRADVAVLQALQPGLIADDEMNPYWFRAPLAPLLAASRERRRIDLNRALGTVWQAAKRCDVLIVEGAGGVLVPLTRRATIADFAAATGGRVVIVGRNRLGIINHTRLTVEALRTRGVEPSRVVLMEERRPDGSAAGNTAYLRRELREIPVYEIPFLGSNMGSGSGFLRAAKKFEKVLAPIRRFATVWTRSLERSRKEEPTKLRANEKNSLTPAARNAKVNALKAK